MGKMERADYSLFWVSHDAEWSQEVCKRDSRWIFTFEDNYMQFTSIETLMGRPIT